MTAKKPMSGSPEKRRDCIAQLPLQSTSGGSKFASEQLNFILTSADIRIHIETPVRKAGRKAVVVMPVAEGIYEGSEDRLV